MGAGFEHFCTPGYLAWYIRADGWVTPCQIEEKTLDISWLKACTRSVRCRV